MIKEEILRNLKENGYSPYVDGQPELTDEDWQDIANELGEKVYFDDTWGIAFTESYAKKYMQMIKPKKK